MSQQTSDLQQSMVELFMAVIAAPDDEEVARRANEAVRELDARLAAPSPSASPSPSP